MRRFAALLTVFLVLFAACGDDDSDVASDDDSETPPQEPVDPAEDDPLLDAVTVSGELGEKPSIEVDGELETEKTVRRPLTEGDGEPLTDGVEFAFDQMMVNGRTGEALEDTFGAFPQPLAFEQMMFPPFIASALVDVPLGSRMLVAIPGEEYFQGADLSEEPRIEEGDDVVLVIDVVEPADVPDRAEGTEVEPVEGLPTVTLGDDGAPSIEVPDEDPPTELVSQELIKGEGEEVAEGGAVMVHYTGVLWDGGEEFDSSWKQGEPVSFSLDEVVEGWGEGLAGHTVGSQVLLVVPPDKGYGPEGGPGGAVPPDSTMVFVVDILGTR